MSDEDEFFDVEDEGEDYHDAQERKCLFQVAIHQCLGNCTGVL